MLTRAALRSSTSQRGPARFSDDAKDDIAQLHIEYDVVTHQLLAEQVRFTCQGHFLVWTPRSGSCSHRLPLMTDPYDLSQSARAAAEADARSLRQKLGDAAQGLMDSANTLGELKARSRGMSCAEASG